MSEQILESQAGDGGNEVVGHECTKRLGRIQEAEVRDGAEEQVLW